MSGLIDEEIQALIDAMENESGGGMGTVINGTTSLSTASSGDDSIWGTDGTDQLSGGSGNDLIVGDDGDDGVIGNNDDDTLYGELDNLSSYFLSVQAVDPNVSLDTVVEDIPTLISNWDDLIQGNHGDDLLVGDIGNFEYIFKGPEDSLGGDIPIIGLTDDRLSYFMFYKFVNAEITGSDQLHGGNGNDSLYGDVQNFLYKIEAPDGVIGGTSNTARADVRANIFQNSSYFTFGDELIMTGGNGDDKIYGDVGQLQVQALGGDSVQGGTSNVVGTGDNSSDSNVVIGTNRGDIGRDGVNLNFGHDQNLLGGSGNDTIVGDVGLLSYEAIAGNDVVGGTANVNEATTTGAFAYIYASTVSFGADINLQGGSGDDLIVGDAEELLLLNKGGDRATHGTTSVGADMFVDVQGRMLSSVMLFGADQDLFGGEGSDTIYGDLVTLNIVSHAGDSLTGGANDSEFVFSRSLYEFMDIFFGDDHNLSGGAHDDVIVGDVGDVNFSIKGGSDSSGNFGATVLFLFNSSGFVAGSDSDLSGGSGDDMIYGDAISVNINIEGGDRNTDGSAAGRWITTPLLFGDDINLLGDSGHDSLYGDFQDFSLHLKGGSDSNGSSTGVTAVFVDYFPFFGNNSITFGNDMNLSGDSGNDELYGDGETSSIDISGGDGSTAQNTIDNGNTGVESYATAISQVNYGHDTLSGGDGNDSLWGDTKDLSIEISGGNDGESGDATSTMPHSTSYAASQLEQYGELQFSSLTTGDDVMDGGSGDDALIGDVDHVLLLVSGGDDGKSGNAIIEDGHGYAVSSVDNSARIRGMDIQLGNDNLSGDAGNDTLHGDVKCLDLDIQGGIMAMDTGALGTQSPLSPYAGLSDANFLTFSPKGGVVSYALMQNTDITLGNDTLSGGSDHDKLYGDVETLDINLQGGVANSTEVIYIDGVGFTLDELKDAETNGTLLALLNVDGLGGFDEDDAVDIAVPMVADARAVMDNVNITLGDDLLTGDDGNDTLFGDVDTVNLTVADGSVLNGLSVMDSDELKTLLAMASGGALGEDTETGTGNTNGSLDLSVAGINFEAWAQALAEIQNSSITFGDDTIIGGTGDDSLVGDVNSENLEDYFQITGGMDTFVFAPGDGHDTISDLDAFGVMDKIDLSAYGLDVNDMDADPDNDFEDFIATYVTQVVDDSVIALSASDSITLIGVDVVDLSSDHFVF